MLISATYGDFIDIEGLLMIIALINKPNCKIFEGGKLLNLLFESVVTVFLVEAFIILDLRFIFTSNNVK